MLSRFPIVLSLIVACCMSTAAASHEFWISPEEYQIAPNEQVRAFFRNGEDFRGIDLPYFDKQSARFEVGFGNEVTEIAPRMGDSPALNFTPEGTGLLVVLHETAPSTIRYRSWAKFQAFADHKDFADMRARHLGRGLPEEGFFESYTRHAKSLIAVGTGAGLDRRFGLETEFVAGANPYTTKNLQFLPVQLFDGDRPRPDAQIEMFEEAPDGMVTVTLHRTDADGRADLPVKAGRTYLLDAVILRESADGSKAVWDTLWAAMTFHIPD